ncbi:hypothetical protein POTOM_007075 [Populus tomentosa]|uniref:Uncharacterized protein n=1 Tax=Populus tomentosa TaxID=118781 RepID=A0A8X8DAZ1_POPTO|nr:hypothetical protein POTOM_007075 [Populus tomentosa]
MPHSPQDSTRLVLYPYCPLHHSSKTQASFDEFAACFMRGLDIAIVSSLTIEESVLLPRFLVASELQSILERSSLVTGSVISEPALN